MRHANLIMNRFIWTKHSVILQIHCAEKIEHYCFKTWPRSLIVFNADELTRWMQTSQIIPLLAMYVLHSLPHAMVTCSVQNDWAKINVLIKKMTWVSSVSSGAGVILYLKYPEMRQVVVTPIHDWMWRGTYTVRNVKLNAIRLNLHIEISLFNAATMTQKYAHEYFFSYL